MTVTNPRMTRFWITLDQGVRFVIRCFEEMHSGEVFVPKIPGMNIMDLIKTVAAECDVDVIGIRPAEKLHEVLILEDEARHTVELDDMYVMQPAHPWWFADNRAGSRSLPGGFRFSSHSNSHWLATKDLRTLVEAA